MLVTDHAIQGGLVLALPAKLAGAPDWLVGTLFAVGAVQNALPDIAPLKAGLKVWRGAALDGFMPFMFEGYVFYSWGTYIEWHIGPKRWLAPLHFFVDDWMHTPDGNWWPRDWKKNILLWTLEIAGVYLLVR